MENLITLCRVDIKMVALHEADTLTGSRLAPAMRIEQQ
jgi:hypothetical protein